MKKLLRGPLIYILLILAIVAIASSFGNWQSTDSKDLTYTEFLDKISNGEVQSVSIMANDGYILSKNTMYSEKDFPEKYDYKVYIQSINQLNIDLR